MPASAWIGGEAGPLHSFVASQVLTQVPPTAHVSQEPPLPGQLGMPGMLPHPVHVGGTAGVMQKPVAEQPVVAVHVVAHDLPSAAHP